MKNLIFCFLLMVSAIALAQHEPIKVVFDVTSSDTDVHKTAAKHLILMAEAYPDSSFEMVIYSGAIQMVDKKLSAASKNLEAALQKKNVEVVVCEQTMKRHKMDATDLIPGIGSVPDGIMEIVLKQKAGWGYIKEAK
ncbi:MAG: DsrE family protein [Bacteroidota bacterium]|uniref:DsrE family protein n=1 Tax=Flagellimonas okinawensis TaxID=3031324 RepID=A0ABT5XNM6_9FLAO|nr:DsrE family protein [[Muricauda] okinawensis]MDF0707500.1 DsrE family protein [[Muricauda] okinawensis]MEC8831211.1 DsrE family protein [Bacteroidota bacterium]